MELPITPYMRTSIDGKPAAWGPPPVPSQQHPGACLEKPESDIVPTQPARSARQPGQQIDRQPHPRATEPHLP